MKAVELTKANQALQMPSLIVFISNTCIMIIELVAGRILAPYLGVSLYTWTSVIGVILAGMSVGNFWGGRLADRYASRRTLGLFFALAGLASLSIIAMVEATSRRGLPVAFAALPYGIRIVFLVTGIFFIPSMLLGMISPVVVKLAVRDLSRTGNTIGGIYASSAFGSIVGTFATGFFLISWLGTRAILLGVGITLLIMGVLIGRWPRDWRVRLFSILLLVIVPFLLPLDGLLKGPCTEETNYFCIKVYDETLEDGSQVRMLALDRLVHSMLSLDAPTHLLYKYEQIDAEVSEYLSQGDAKLEVLVLGGGAYVFPRYMELEYPQSRVDVVEIDPVVTQIAYDKFGLPANTAIRSYNQDARQFMQELDPTRRYDFILCDAINDVSVPYHLTTREFDALIRQHLAEEGIYVVNIIDGNRRLFLTPMLRTLRQVFANVYLVPTGSNWETNPRTTYVLLASSRPIDIARLRQMTGGDGKGEIDQWIITQERLEQVLAEGSQFILTDDYVPVDNLLAPVVEVSQNLTAP